MLKKHSEEGIIVYEEEKGNTVKRLFWLIFGILIFVIVFFPLFGQGWRFQLSPLFDQIFDAIGNACLFIGALFSIWGIAGILCGSRGNGVKCLVIGALLIVIANYFLNPGFIYVGEYGTEIPQGYH